jgi:ribose/xylose/arabinose/galactoside ABC-type transport system permease subunit
MTTPDKSTIIARRIVLGVAILVEVACVAIAWFLYSYISTLPKDIFQVLPSNHYGWGTILTTLGAIIALAVVCTLFSGLLGKIIAYVKSK